MLNWKLSLFAVLLVILLAVPLSINYLLTYQSPLGETKILVITCFR